MWKKAIKLCKSLVACAALTVAVLACNVEYTPPNGGSSSGGGNNGDAYVGFTEVGLVVDVIDGDTIDVNINGTVQRIRYVGVNTPERDEVCYQEAKAANTGLVMGQTVGLMRDVSDTDRFDRLLRYVYVGSTHINEQLVRNGYAEAVLYEPDRAFYDAFLQLERQAASAGLGCHPTGIFNDGSTTR